MLENSNMEELEKPKSWELSLLLGYHVLCLVSSLIGDTVILIATRTKDAFKLNKHLVAVIQHLAIIDLALCLAWILPNILNMASLVGWNHWLLDNEIFCQIKMILLYFLSSVTTNLFSVLTFVKLVILKLPLRISTWKKNKTQFLCASVWFANLWVPTIAVVFRGNYPEKGKKLVILDCISELCPTLMHVHAGTVVYFPFLIIILTTVPTLQHLFKGRKVSRKSGGNLRWQGILTVTLTASAFCVSYLPYAITTVYKKSTIFIRIAWYLPLINIMSNFYIYLLTVHSFRKFLLLKLKVLASCLGFRRNIVRNRS